MFWVQAPFNYTRYRLGGLLPLWSVWSNEIDVIDQQSSLTSLKCHFRASIVVQLLSSSNRENSDSVPSPRGQICH